MPTWAWITVLLIVIVAVWVAATWYAQRLSARNDEPAQRDTAVQGGTDDLPAGASVARQRRTPNPSTVPPPALAGPLRENSGVGGTISSNANDELPAPPSGQTPASTPSRTPTRPAGGPARTTKAPPVQAAWSAPQKEFKRRRLVLRSTRAIARVVCLPYAAVHKCGLRPTGSATINLPPVHYSCRVVTPDPLIPARAYFIIWVLSPQGRVE